MQDWNTMEEILEYAIDREQAAVDLYAGLSERMTRPSMAKVFADLANVERGHKVRLERLKSSGTVKFPKRELIDLHMADYLVEVEATPDMDYQDVLILAMKAEKRAFRLYSALAAATEGTLQEVFTVLAQEEAAHKMRFELEYDEIILRDN